MNRLIAQGTLLLALLAPACASSAGAEKEPVGCPKGDLSVSGNVVRFAMGAERQTFVGEPGVEVCVHGNDDVECATTPDSGGFELCGVPSGEILLSFTKDNFIPMVRMLDIGVASYLMNAPTVVGSFAQASEVAAVEGLDADAYGDGGAIQFFAMHSGDGVAQLEELEGYTVRLAPEVGDPPVYMSEAGGADLSLTASTRRGVGGIANVPPGDYDLIFEHSEPVGEQLECNEPMRESGFLTDTPHALRVRIVKGFTTAQVGMICDPPL